MICSTIKTFKFIILLLSVSIYADTSIINSNNSHNIITSFEDKIKTKKNLLEKINKSNVSEYTSLYDQIVELTINKNNLLLKFDRIDEIDTDKTCDLALNYEEVEFIKTQYYKTPFHDEVATTLQNIASLYKQCYPPMAEKQLLPILKIKEHIYSRESTEVADTHDLIADYYRIYMANFKKAIKEYERAKKIREAIFGMDDPRTTKNNANLALSLYYYGDKLNKGEKILLDSIGIHKNSVSKDFPLYKAYKDLGVYYSIKNIYEKSIIYLHKALESFKGEVNPDYIVILRELSQNYFNKNDLDNALKFADEAYRVSKKFYETDTHHKVLENSLRLKEIQEVMNDYKEK